MSTYISASSNAEAWVRIMEHLIGQPGGKCFHLVTSIADPVSEIKDVTQIVDDLAGKFGVASTMENANVIWPFALAPPNRDLKSTIKKMQEFAAPLIKSAKPQHDSYLERLVAWRSRDAGATVPQLEKIVERMQTEAGNPGPKSSSYELSIFSPGLDSGYMSFPCLSHLSFKLDTQANKIHLAALYRNHHFISHGYGNFLGLGRLMQFVARQVGYEVGELLSISTHADGELSKGRTLIKEHIAKARAALSSSGLVGYPHAEEVKV
jgi:hypothetical protein